MKPTEPKSFVKLTGKDGFARAMHFDDIRLLEDIEEGGATVTLCDGTQFNVAESIKKILPALG